MISRPAAGRRANQAQRHLAYESLHSALVLRRIPAGERLREPVWSRRLGVNRAALREALARLYAEGLVQEGERGGYFVPRLSPSEKSEIIFAREMIETSAGEQAIQSGRNRPEHLRELLAACDDLAWMVERGYTAELGEADQLFHSRLVDVAANHRLGMLHRSLPLPSPAEELIPFNGTAHAVRVLQEHQAVAAALREGDANQFRQLLHLHYQALLPSRP